MQEGKNSSEEFNKILNSIKYKTDILKNRQKNDRFKKELNLKKNQSALIQTVVDYEEKVEILETEVQWLKLEENDFLKMLQDELEKLKLENKKINGNLSIKTKTINYLNNQLNIKMKHDEELKRLELNVEDSFEATIKGLRNNEINFKAQHKELLSELTSLKNKNEEAENRKKQLENQIKKIIEDRDQLINTINELQKIMKIILEL
ncbi:35495_t:CDS:2 [Gigaspora margarita]|uniref:35495_t:CDS:1 n=1 Tax=Gigaspora margarita TaxID=4874 RepID=A0ABM8VVW7_GIGMA|nr:35495_t:CDS:2 [Gigaspora margarita]